MEKNLCSDIFKKKIKNKYARSNSSNCSCITFDRWINKGIHRLSKPCGQTNVLI